MLELIKLINSMGPGSTKVQGKKYKIWQAYASYIYESDTLQAPSVNLRSVGVY